MPRRSVRDSQLRLGDSWVTEPTEDTSSDYDDDDDKGVPEHTPQRREVPRRLTRSSKKTIEPEPQRPSPRSMQRSRLHLGDSWIPENDGSSAIGEHATTSDHDEKGVPEEPLQGRETARKMTRSSKRTIEPESQRLSPRSMQESQLQLGDSWMPENDGSSAIGEHATSDHDDKGVPEKPLQGRETARKMTRSSRKTIEPELVMPAIDHDVGKSGHLDRIKSEETQRPPRRSVTEDASPRRRSARLANGDQKSSHQPSERLQQRPTAGRPRKRTVRDSLPTQVRTEWLVEPLVLWIFDTLMMVIRLLKYPASLFVAGLIIAAMISYLIALLSGLMSKAMSAPFSSFSSIPLRPLRPLIPSLSSICGLPIVSVLCPQGPAKSRDGNPPVKFDEMMKVQGKFEELLESATENYGLPQDMKRSEASIRDLRSLVRFSSLHSKNELLLEFAGFIETAGKASYQLQTYNIRIGGTVDHILAINRWTKRALEDIALRDSSRGAVQSFFGDKLQWLSNRSGSSEKALVKQYIQHTGRVQEKINKVIAEAEDLLGVLNNLDQRLEVIRGIVDDENGQAMQSKEEILTQLWTMVGGNRGELSKTNRRLKLLGEVGQYRQNAYAHVSNTITRLQQIGGALQQLQEHVGAPELDEEDSDVPFVVHLETIQSGIERLEASRNQARRLQDDYWKKFREGDYAEWSRLS